MPPYKRSSSSWRGRRGGGYRTSSPFAFSASCGAASSLQSFPLRPERIGGGNDDDTKPVLARIPEPGALGRGADVRYPFRDGQLDVYSSEIIDLILRAAAEIESIAKELYFAESGTTDDRTKIKFDRHALTDLIGRWNLDAKVVILSSPNMFFTTSEIRPLEYNSKNGWDEDSWEWNTVSYQPLKHNRAASMNVGNLKYLIRIMAALYLLNLYFRNEEYDSADHAGTNLPAGLGSRLFSVDVDSVGWSGGGKYLPTEKYDRSCYLVLPTDKYLREYIKVSKALSEQRVAQGGFAGESDEVIVARTRRAATETGFFNVTSKAQYIARPNRNEEKE